MKNISSKKVAFYSIKFKGEYENEYEKFLKKEFLKHQIELEILKKIISSIAINGAKPYYFEKPERGAFALPSVSPEIKKANKKDFGIRLYCLYLTPQIVVLLNGDIKTHNDPMQCKNVSKFFNYATKLARKLEKAKEADQVRYDYLKLDFDDDFFFDL